MPRHLPSLALLFLAMALAVSPAEAADRRRVKQLTEALGQASAWRDAAPLVEELGALGEDARPALSELLQDLEGALGESGQETQISALTDALGLIGADAPFQSLTGREQAWCSDSKALFSATKEILKSGSPEQIESFLGIPGVLWDLADGAEGADFWLPAALTGLSNPRSAGSWAVALRTRFHKRPDQTFDAIEKACEPIDEGRTSPQSLFLRISLWGHQVKVNDRGEPRYDGIARLSDITGIEQLVQSELAHERESAAFLLANLPPSIQDPRWILGLLRDKNETVRQTAIWTVGFIEFGGNRLDLGADFLPFIPTAIPGSETRKPPLSEIGGGAGGKFGGRSPNREPSDFDYAESMGAHYDPPKPPEPFHSNWGDEFASVLQLELEGLHELVAHKDLAYWSLCRFPGTDGRHLARVEQDYRKPPRNRVILPETWHKLIGRAGGPSREFALDYLKGFQGIWKRPLYKWDIQFVLPIASKEAQQLVLDLHTESDRRFWDLVNTFPVIEGHLATFMIKTAQSEGGLVMSLIPRCEGGASALIELLADERPQFRLTALVALAHGKQAVATPAVQQMFTAAKEDERTFIRKWWSEVDPDVVFE